MDSFRSTERADDPICISTACPSGTSWRATKKKIAAFAVAGVLTSGLVAGDHKTSVRTKALSGKIPRFVEERAGSRHSGSGLPRAIPVLAQRAFRRGFTNVED
jgi:hypothetical protein